MEKILNYKPRKGSDKPLFFFHYWEDDEIKYQGYFISSVPDGRFVVMLFDWVMGEPNGPYAVDRSFFDECTFYDSDHEMRRAYGD